MRFWQLRAPDYPAGDYQDANINGSIDWDLSFPVVDCDICLTSWGCGGGNPLPFECPQSIRGEMSTRNRKRSLFLGEHVALQKRLLEELNVRGEPFVDVRPGSRFPPLYLDVPSRPRADFLWPYGAVLVSNRVRELLVDLCHEDVATFPVNLRKVGKREAKLPAPIPRSGEPEDIINEAPLLTDTSAVGPYYEIFPRYASNEPPNRTIESRCFACGRVETKVAHWNWRDPLRMADDTWRGHSMFYLGTTLHIVVIDDVRNALESILPSNMRLAEVLCL